MGKRVGTGWGVEHCTSFDDGAAWSARARAYEAEGIYQADKAIRSFEVYGLRGGSPMHRAADNRDLAAECWIMAIASLLGAVSNTEAVAA